MEDIFNKLNPPWNYVVILLAATIVTVILHSALFRLIKSIFSKSEFIRYSDLVPLKPPTLSLALLLVGLFGLNIFDVNESALVMNVTKLTGILIASWLTIVVVGAIRKTITNKLRMEDEDNLKARKLYTELRVAERVLTVLILVVGIGSGLMVFPGIRHIGTSILTTAGIAGIIVGLAAQRVIGGVLAGLQLAITQTIRLEDVVIVEGEWGNIEEIGLTYVVVRIWDKRRLILPTTYFIEKPFQNWTRISADLIGTVFIRTDFRIPVSVLREEQTKILRETHLWDQKVDVLQVTDSTEKTMELRSLVSAKNSPTLWDLRVHVREKLIEFLQHNYTEFLPKTRVIIENAPPK